ncbi:ceramide kinase-like [Ostrea edulis]|uniref:ceramide kinase-like n=1 Tax=Ostrea edulis TaxID=37623 RepID=UPI0024AF9550|nr:ceramide kinase-like [Ostrea edulis]
MVRKVDIKSIVLETDELNILERKKVNCNVKICDVIGCHSCEKPTGFLSSLFSLPPNIVIRYISKGPKYKWTVETVEVTGSEKECEALKNRINEKLGQDKERPKKLGIFINPIGGNQNSLDIYSRVVSPLFKAANITCDVLVSERPKHMIELIGGFDTACVDGLVVIGGDGTLLEILNVLLTKVQKEAGVDYDQPTSKLKPLEVPIGVIPTGTGNGFANGLYGNIDIVTAVLHTIKGRTNYNNIQGIYTGGKMASFSAVVIGCGLFSDLIYHTDKQRWLKRARYVVVPIYRLFLKGQRVFNAKVTIFPIKPSSDGQGNTGGDESGSTEETEGEICGVVSFGGDLLYCVSESKLDYVEMTRYSRKIDGFCLLIYRETGKFSFMSHFFQLMSLSRSAFERDFLSRYTVRGYKVKLLDRREFQDPNSDEAQIEKIIDVDGELIEIVDGEYEVWNHMKMAKFYTCY